MPRAKRDFFVPVDFMRQSNLPLVLSAAAVLVLSVPLVLWVLSSRPGARPSDLGPLVMAARSGDAESVRRLVDGGADPDRRDDGPNGWTPLLHAVHKDRPAAVRELISAGADVNRAAPNGLTPLMLAASQGELEIFEDLLAAGADPRAEKPGGETVLTHAVLGGEPEIVHALLERAPDLRLRNTMEDWGARAFAWVRGRSEVLKEVGR